jgi:steroid delta-isomerase-like uncharacterized protein
MSVTENQAVARRWFEDVFNGRDMDAADRFVAPEHVLHDSASGSLDPGPEGTRQFVAPWRRIFPDIQIFVDKTIAVGDTVVLRWSATGTYSGEPLKGIEPNGNRVHISGLASMRVSDGLLRETWMFFDLPGLLRQVAFWESQVDFQGSPVDFRWPPIPPWW